MFGGGGGGSDTCTCSFSTFLFSYWNRRVLRNHSIEFLIVMIPIFLWVILIYHSDSSCLTIGVPRATATTNNGPARLIRKRENKSMGSWPEYGITNWKNALRRVRNVSVHFIWKIMTHTHHTRTTRHKQCSIMTTRKKL